MQYDFNAPPKFDPSYPRWRMQMDAYIRLNKERDNTLLPELIENRDIIRRVAKNMGITDEV